MQDRFFFEKAVNAAEKGPEAFAAEFKKPKANANVLDWYLEPLIHTIIRKIPDKNLPMILTTLIEYKVDLESYNQLKNTPLALAARYAKKNAVEFLLEKKANIHDPEHPALNSVLSGMGTPAEKLTIVKILLEHGANINFQDNLGYSPLMNAAYLSDPTLIDFLILKNADISLGTYEGSSKKTVVGIIYENYILTKKEFGDNHRDTIQEKTRLDMLLRLIIVRCRQLAPLSIDDPSILEYLNYLAGNFSMPRYKEVANSTNLMMDLKKNIQKQIEKEQYATFLKGSEITEKQPSSALHRFFQRDGSRDLTRWIFSFVHDEEEKKPQMTKAEFSSKRTKL